MLNWIADVNRFHAPKPPQWFLQALWDQDAALVILPSRVRRAYMLARRRQSSLPAAEILRRHAELYRRTAGRDHDLLSGHGLVLVDYIAGYLHGNWTAAMLADLRRRDTWAVGAERYTDRIEASEQLVADRKRAALISDIEHRAGDAWRSLQARTGARNQRSGSGSAHIVKTGTL